MTFLVAKADVMDVVIVTSIFAGVLLVLAGVIALVKRWFDQTQERDDPSGGLGLMAQVEAMYERGELSEEEYKKIKDKMKARIRDRIDSK